MLCISAAYAVMRCLSVCLSVCVCVCVTFVSCVKTNKDIFEFFSPSSQAILVFPCQTGWRYSDGNPPNGGVECRWGIGYIWQSGKNRVRRNGFGANQDQIHSSVNVRNGGMPT